MNRRHLLLVFKQDGRQLLRDRRTLFVNLVLPVLLYPVLALVAVQTVQMTRPSGERLPRIAGAMLPGSVHLALPVHADAAREQKLILATVEQRQQKQLQQLVGSDADTERRATLHWLRRQGCCLALVGLSETIDGQHRNQVVVVGDNAHRDYQVALSVVKQSLRQVSQELRQAVQESYGIPLALREPLVWAVQPLAPPAEAARTQLAGVIPLILLLMALSGSFHPALDLIAGERERGTLETLLSWPADRRSIFTGKLLLVMTASLASVVLNLLSLGLTTGLVAAQLPAETGAKLTGGLAIDPQILLAGFMMLLPLTLTLATISLALAGIAASYKEAQNYLSPLLLMVMTPAMICLLPHVDPSFSLDLLPVLGPLVVLKNALQSGQVAWAHALLATTCSAVVCVVVVQWAVRLLAQEHFLYPQLVRQGWGRFTSAPFRPAVPGGIEVLLLFGAALGVFFLASGVLSQTAVFIRVTGPLLLGVACPALLFVWLGDFDPRRVLSLRGVRPLTLVLLPVMVPIGMGIAMALGVLQLSVVEGREQVQVGEQIRQILQVLREQGGMPLVLLAVAVVPAVCEELLFRGPILQGLSASLGRLSGVLISSFLFAVMHMSPARLFPQFALGVLLAALTLRTRSLLPAILVHVAHNSIAVLMDAGNQSQEPTFASDDPQTQLLDELARMAPALQPWLDQYGIGVVLVMAGIALPLFGVAAVLVIRLMQPIHSEPRAASSELT